MPCKMCGTCCKAILLGRSMEEIKEKYQEDIEMFGEEILDDRYFIINNWEEITYDEAIQINPNLWPYIPENGNYFYKCKLLTEDNKCPVHGENQPYVCKGYPWYGRPPHKQDFWYTPECGYYLEYKKKYEKPLKALEWLKIGASIFGGRNKK